MDKTIRNLDEKAYRALLSRAALEGKNVGDLVSEAIRLYLHLPISTKNAKPFAEHESFNFGKRNKHLSVNVDSYLYK